MKSIEAVVLLLECRDVADKLLREGASAFLSREELGNLRGFKGVLTAWADRPPQEAQTELDILYQLAGLDREQVEVLVWASQYRLDS